MCVFSFILFSHLPLGKVLYCTSLAADTVILFQKGGYRGFYSKNIINLTPKTVNDIHKRGGTILGSSRGGHDTTKIVDSIQDRGINQVPLV